MNYLRKSLTFVKLLSRGDGGQMRRRWKQFLNARQVARAGGKMFAHRRLGFSAVCHPEWRDSLEVFLDLAGDHAEMAWLADWLKPQEACMDIGANVGLYTFCFAETVGPQGKVISVDADGFIVGKMRAASQLLDACQIQPVHAAVSDQAGQKEFYISAGQANTFEQSLARPSESSESYRMVNVQGLTIGNLVSLLPDSQILSLIKVDIEGAEATALRVAPPELLSSAGPLWQVEIHPGALARFGASPSDIVKFFEAEHFECWLLPKHPHNNAHGATAPRRLALNETFSDSIYYNLICIPRGKKWEARRKKLVRELETCAHDAN